MAPVQHKWFAFLSKTFPLTKSSGTSSALKRVAFDQLLFSPVGLAIFFTFMTVAEGGGKRAVTRKFQDLYVPALKANYLVWPAVQMLNFRVIPLQFQIVSTILPCGVFAIVDMLSTALRFDYRYCLDGVPVPHDQFTQHRSINPIHIYLPTSSRCIPGVGHWHEAGIGVSTNL